MRRERAELGLKVLHLDLKLVGVIRKIEGENVGVTYGPGAATASWPIARVEPYNEYESLP